jgi:hypothetical protein
MVSRMNGSFERIKSLIRGKQRHAWKSLVLAGKGVHSAGDIAADALDTLTY